MDIMDVDMDKEEGGGKTSLAEGVAVAVANNNRGNARQVEAIATHMVIAHIPVLIVKPAVLNITPKQRLQTDWAAVPMVVSGMNDRSGIQIVLILITNVY